MRDLRVSLKPLNLDEKFLPDSLATGLLVAVLALALAVGVAGKGFEGTGADIVGESYTKKT